MSGGQNTTTTQSGPPEQFLQQYQKINDQAQQVGSTPYTTGGFNASNLQAELSPDQLAAINSIQGSQGIANPYINSAAQEIGASTAPLAPTIQPYVDQAQGLFSGAANQNLSNIAGMGTAGSDNYYAQSAQTAGALPSAVQPGIGAANKLYDQSAQTLNPTQFSAGQVGQYESPYTQQVVNATQNEFNNQNAQQRAGIQGNAISQGAFGGDREGVAQGITAGQEALAQAPVIAGLENQGYSQALGEFNTQQQVGLGAQQATQQLKQGAAQGILAGGQQEANALAQESQLQQGAGAGLLQGSAQRVGAAQGQGQLGIAAGQGISGLGGQVLGANEANAWLDSQAGFGLGNLGNEAQSTALQGANAELGVGGLEQQQAQGALNIPYEQFIAQQAYPFQTTGWQANIAEGLGGASGGTGTTTSPGPSVGSQVAGTALTGVGLVGATGGFGSGGWATNLFNGAGGASGAIDSGAFDVLAARGGAVPHRAPGGGLPSAPFGGINIPTGTSDVSMSIVPGGGGLGDASGHKGPNILNTSTGSTTTTTGGDSTLGGLLKGAGQIAAGIYGGPAGALAAGALGSQVHFSKGGGLSFAPAPHANGIAGAHNFLPHIPKLAGGGIVVPQLPTGSGIGGAPTSTKGGNGIDIPQINFHGGSASSGGSPANVSDYLAKQQQAGANRAPPQTFQPIQAGVAPSPPAGAAPAPGPVGTPGVPGQLDGPLTQDQINSLQGVAATQDRNIQNGMLASFSGFARGGIVHRDDGGYIPEPPMPPEGGPPPQGIAGPPEPPPTFAEQNGPPPGSAPAANEEKPTIGGHKPWEALLAAGLGIMGGTSPHALTNIGRGGMEGLQFAERQRVADEQTALRRLQQQDLAAYRQSQTANAANKVDQYGRRIDVLQQEANTHGQSADTHAQAIQNTDAYRSRVLDLRGRGIDERTANDQALNEIRQQNANTALYGAFTRGNQADQRLQQGDQRIQQGADRIAQSHEAQTARLALTQRGQDAGSANADIRAAASMVASGAVPNFGDALKRVQAGRSTQQPTAAPVATQPAAVPDPLGIR